MVPMVQARKDPNNEIIYCDSCNAMTITDCCLSKIQMSEFAVQDSKTQVLLDLKSMFHVFKNGFNKAMQNSKENLAFAKTILKKKIEV